MAIGLFTAIHSHVTAEDIERFFSNTECTPISGGTHHARGCEIVTHFDDCLLDLIRRRDDITDHAAFGAVAVEAATHHYCLTRRARTNKTGQAQIRSPRDNAFLARG